MKKIFLICSLIIITTSIYGQTWSNYSIKAEYMHGTILKHNKHLENLVKGPSTGGEIAVEWQTMGEQAWHQCFNFPTVGIGAVYMDYSNPEMLGYGIAVYPYMNIPVVRTRYFTINIKPGVGVSFLNKRYSNTPHMPGTLNGPGGEPNRANAAIGSVMNVYLSGGANLEVPIAYGFSLTADYAWNHVSNGSVVQPNSGINMLNAYIGLKYAPNHKIYNIPEKRLIRDISRKFTYELTISGGSRQLFYNDSKYNDGKSKNYFIGSLALSVHRPFANWYRMGLGADVFYDGVFGAVNSSAAGNEKTTDYGRTYIDTDEFKNKIRAGVSWQHELIIGRLTGGFHFGLYLYDPIKNLEPGYTNGELKKPDTKKSLIYKYNIDNEDGWFYARASVKYLITDHLYAAIGLKTHLQKAEFIEWGLGWKF